MNIYKIFISHTIILHLNVIPTDIDLLMQSCKPFSCILIARIFLALYLEESLDVIILIYYLPDISHLLITLLNDDYE